MSSSAWKETTRWSMRTLSRQSLTKDTARQLILDTSLRLEGQTYFLNQLQNQLQSLSPSSSSSSSIGRGELANKTKDTTEPRIIRASNSSITSNLLDWRGHLERERDKHKSLQQAHQWIQNLLYLHHDTQKLTQQLLNSERIWKNPTMNLIHSSSTIMEQIRSRHATSLETMADIVLLVRKHDDVNNYTLSFSQDSNLFHFLRGRLSVQILCDHYVNLHKQQQQQKRQHVHDDTRHGAVHIDSPLEPILQDAWTEAKHLCEAHYQTSPSVQFPIQSSIPNITCIRPWLHYCLVEIFKNSMVASLEMMASSKMESKESLPPTIIISVEETTRDNKSDSWICLKIEDSGPGLVSKNPFTFASCSEKWDRLNIQQSYASVRSPLSSMGVGVPSSQWLLQHFGGDLELLNRTDSHGCTAILWLPRNDEILEYLPAE